MATLKITAKRQATFPRKLMEDLGLNPGDDIEVVPKKIKGELVWVLKPVKYDLSWVGGLHKYATKKDAGLSMEEIRDKAFRKHLKDKKY